ncbi:hypothetical protein ILYODFUR_017165 [Ilyodon furcidens]|uniref:Uncharacterized protein n=1 Tax=Ilyodon furcidens TaxID=33524 RepID=A0ABV0TX65_9TELE
MSDARQHFARQSHGESHYGSDSVHTLYEKPFRSKECVSVFLSVSLLPLSTLVHIDDLIPERCAVLMGS